MYDIKILIKLNKKLPSVIDRNFDYENIIKRSDNNNNQFFNRIQLLYTVCNLKQCLV